MVIEDESYNHDDPNNFKKESVISPNFNKLAD